MSLIENHTPTFQNHMHQAEVSLFLRKAESSFIAAVLDGSEALARFGTDWAFVDNHLRTRKMILPEEGLLAHTASEQVLALATSFSNICINEEHLTQSLMQNVESILDNSFSTNVQMISSSTNANNVPEPSILRAAIPCIQQNKTSTKNLTSAMRWLASHCFNPYPPASVKQSIARSSNMSMKAIEDWFTNARRKIGWNAFSKRHFGGNRSLTLDCAHRVLAEGMRGDTYCDEIVRELEEIKATTGRLYDSPEKSDAAETSNLAKELESLGAQTCTIKDERKRHPPRCSVVSEQPTETSSLPTGSSLRKRPRASEEEFDAGYHAEDSTAVLPRPLKRGRSVSLVSNCSSRDSSASSFTTCSSESNESVSETNTLVVSPTQSKLPLEIIDEWIERIANELDFLPHDISDKPLQSVMSCKRSSSYLDSDTAPKRMRLDRVQPQTNKSPNQASKESGTIGVLMQDLFAPPSQTQWPFKEPVTLPVTGGASDDEQPASEVYKETVNQICPHINFSIPQPPLLVWDASLFNRTSGTSVSGHSSIDPASEPSSDLPIDTTALLWDVAGPVSAHNLQLPASEAGLVSARALRHNASQGGANSSEGMLPSGDSQMDASSTADDRNTRPNLVGSLPITLSSLDFAFLENLSSASQLHPTDLETSSSKESLSSTLVDVTSPSGPESSTYNVLEHLKRPESHDQLLAEAQKLQLEVFG